MILLTVMVLGIVSALHMPVSLIPDMDIPYITVQINAPGMSARELDESAVSVLRTQLSQIDGLADIRCEARDGSAVLRLKFSHGDDIDFRFIEVNERIDRCMSSLPRMERPHALKSVATDIPAFYLNATPGNGADFLLFSDFVRNIIVKRLEQLDEVAMVDVSGFREKEILILPDKAKLSQSGITMKDLQALIASADIRLGNLTISDGQYRYNVRFQSNASGKEDLENLWINHDGKLLRLGDIASVSEQAAPATGALSSDGRPAICMAVIKQSSARMSDLRKAMSAQLEMFAKDYPEVEFNLTRDQTELLDYSIYNLIRNIVTGILLACLIIFLFMKDFRSPGLVALTMPAALIASMLVFRIAGMSLNILSLSGLLLGVGMLTDNTIVLVDNVTARWLRGEDLKDAVLRGTAEVTGPMLSSMLTTCAVFIPLVSVSGTAGAMFRDQAIAVATVLLTAYLVTITVVPVYYWAWYRRLPAFRSGRLLTRFRLGESLEKWDGKWSRWMLSHRWAAWAALAVSFAGCLFCFYGMPKTLLPEITEHDTLLRIDWDSSISPEENLARCNAAASASGARGSTVMAGTQQFALSHSGDTGPGEALVYLDFEDAASLAAGKASMASYFRDNYPDAGFSFSPSGNIFNYVFSAGEPELVARLRPVASPSIDVPALRECISGIQERIPESRLQKIPVTEQLVFAANPQLMSLYGLSYDNLLAALKTALNSDRIMSIVQGDRSVPVVLGGDSAEVERVLNSDITTPDGISLPLSALLVQSRTEDLKTLVSGPEGPYYPLAIEPGLLSAEKTMESVRTSVRENGKFETGFSGTWFDTRKMTGDMLLTLLISILLLYLILAAQFESMIQPVIILLEIIIDVFVALLALWVTGQTVNLMSLIGLVVISGIVVNDSILKIDTINRLRKSGMEMDEAILTAGARRVKAIVMTSLTTILAVCPFLMKGDMGSDLQFPLSVVIISGMAVGTLVSLFIVPALYKSVSRR